MRLEQGQQLVSQRHGEVSVAGGGEVDDPATVGDQPLTVTDENGGLSHAAIAAEDVDRSAIPRPTRSADTDRSVRIPVGRPAARATTQSQAGRDCLLETARGTSLSVGQGC